MTKIVVFGTGLMGQPMTLKLAGAHLPVMAYNRTGEKLIPLQSNQIKVSTHPEEAIAFGECLILMLTNANAIEEVILNSKSDLQGKTIIQMGTIAPDESKTLQAQIQQRGGEYLEAPVLGSIPEVKKGTLLVMVGGSQRQFNQWQELLKNFSQQPLLVGEVGTASAMKLALNQLIAGLTSTFALSLAMIQKQGVEVSLFMDILRESALYAPTFDKKLARMCEHNYSNPNFPTKHLLKDIGLFLTQANKIGLNTKALQGIEAIVNQAVKQGLAEEDYSALFEAIYR